ncbi:MAG: hypothetical protein OXE43_11920 [Chloroflexi bacterium]|nr:hypothetical protein [Chloroflexota bacterium]
MTDDRSIVGRADGLRVEVEKLSALRRAAASSTTLETRADQLENAATGLLEQAGRVQLFRAHGIRLSFNVDLQEQLLKATREHRSAFDADPASIVADPTDSTFKYEYLRGLESLHASIRRRLGDEWNRYIDSLTPGGLSELEEALTRVPQVAGDLAAIRRLHATLNAERAEAPTSVADFERAEAVAQDLQDHWQTLQSIPEDVREFLAAASTGGAPLDDLTPSIRDWLEKTNSLGLLRYVLKEEA